MNEFPLFLATTFSAHAVAMASLVGLVGLIYDLPFRSLVVPFLVLAYCGIIFSTLLFMARVLGHRWPRWLPLICGLFMMSYVEVLMMALGFGAVRLHLMSAENAVSDFLAVSAPVCLSAFAGGYIAGRLMVRPQQSD
jgi:hypothetical protein